MLVSVIKTTLASGKNVPELSRVNIERGNSINYDQDDYSFLDISYGDLTVFRATIRKIGWCRDNNLTDQRKLKIIFH